MNDRLETQAARTDGVPSRNYRIATAALLVLFAPAGILLMWRAKLWTHRSRVVSSAGSALLFVVAVIGGQLSKEPGDEVTRTDATVTNRMESPPSTKAVTPTTSLPPDPSTASSVLPTDAAVPTEPREAKQGFWDGEFTKIADGEHCPVGFWSLFAGQAPGKDEFEQRENDAKRKQLATEARARTYVVTIERDIELKAYDFKRKQFPIELLATGGTITCDAPTSSGKSITIAFGSPRPVDLTARAGDGDGRVGMNEWQAPAIRVVVPIAESLAKEFKASHETTFGVDLRAQVAFTIERATEHHRKVRVTDTVSGFDDYGAGRLIVAKIAGMRVYDRDDNATVFETIPPSR